jgi:pentatricopeptide repeat protein
MKALRGFRVKKVKSSKGKDAEKVSLDHKIYLIDAWKKQGRLFAHNFYQEMLDACMGEIFREPKYMNTALGFFDDIKKNFQVEIRDYHLIILCCARAGQYQKGVEFFNEFLKQGFQPDQQMFMSMIRLCALANDKATAEKYFQEMLSKGLCPPFYSFDTWYTTIQNL